MTLYDSSPYITPSSQSGNNTLPLPAQPNHSNLSNIYGVSYSDNDHTATTPMTESQQEIHPQQLQNLQNQMDWINNNLAHIHSNNCLNGTQQIQRSF